MKRKLAILLCSALLAVSAGAQTDSVIHIKTFPGTTVGQKVTAAMQTCQSAPVPCILVIDASLAATASGTMPTLCGNCHLLDYRNGIPITSAVSPGMVDASAQAGATADAKLNACEAALAAAGGGICDARGFGLSTQTIAATVNLCDGVHPMTWLFAYPTTFAPQSSATTLTLFNAGYNYCTISGELHVDTTGATGYIGRVINIQPSVGLNQWPHIDDFYINNASTSGTTGPYCLYFYSDSGPHSVQQADVSGTCIGGSEGAHLEQEGGWVNDNRITLWDFNSVHPVNIVSGQNGFGLQISANRIWLNAENFYPNSSTNANVLDDFHISGPGDVLQNDVSLYAQDLPAGVPSVYVAASTPAEGNHFHGLLYRYTDLSSSGVGNFFVDYQQNASGWVSGTLQEDGSGNWSFLAPILATASNNYWSAATKFCGNYWTGTASAPDCWWWETQLGGGSNPQTTFTANHSGSTGTAAVNIPFPLTATTFTAGSGGQTVYRCTVAGALPIGALTVATGNCGASGATDTGLRTQ